MSVSKTRSKRLTPGERAAQLRARADRLEALEKRKTARRTTRRRILVGAYLFARYGDDVSQWAAGTRADLAAYLTRSVDRRAFPELGEAVAPAAPSASTAEAPAPVTMAALLGS